MTLAPNGPARPQTGIRTVTEFGAERLRELS